MKNRKRLIVSSIILSLVVVTICLQKKKNEQSPSSPFENAGVPDQVDRDDLAQFENAKMVSEGSQFGVQYYNQFHI